MNNGDNQKSKIENCLCVSIGNMPALDCFKLASQYPLVEIRFDLLSDIAADNMHVLGLHCRQWIATCRPGNLTQQERTKLLAAAIYARATYIDIEYEAEPDYRQALMDLARQHSSKVIISYHNFETTPEIDALNDIIRQSKEMGADYVKLVTTATCAADCARIMSLYAQHDNLLAFAMGAAGKITRVAMPFLGAAFTYVCADEAHKTAPGQLTAPEMEGIIRKMSVFHCFK